MLAMHALSVAFSVMPMPQRVARSVMPRALVCAALSSHGNQRPWLSRSFRASANPSQNANPTQGWQNVNAMHERHRAVGQQIHSLDQQRQALEWQSTGCTSSVYDRAIARVQAKQFASAQVVATPPDWVMPSRERRVVNIAGVPTSLNHRGVPPQQGGIPPQPGMGSPQPGMSGGMPPQQGGIPPHPGMGSPQPGMSGGMPPQQGGIPPQPGMGSPQPGMAGR